jgi:FtsP/CotA-like multicopper oxidase with cupredoxin domain
MSTLSLSWLALSLATLSSVTALPHEDKRSLGQWVTATIDGRIASWQNDYSGPAITLATKTANPLYVTAATTGPPMVTATIDGKVVSWVNDWPLPSTASQPTAAAPTASSVQSGTPFLPPTTSGGLSTFGTLDQPYYPKYLSGYSSSNKVPWGSRVVSDNAYDSANVPNTGITRYYNFTVYQSTTNADGVVRDTMTVNGQFPGPAIEANWGDWIEVTVTNNLGFEGTSMHWHGLRQSQSPEMDGVPSLTQCPIAPGASFTYRYQAEVYGSSWYHAHYSAQNNAGILGPMIIYGPSSADYDLDVGPVLLTDWYRLPYPELVAQYVGTDLSIIPFIGDNNLINGRNTYPCGYDNTTDASNCDSNAPLSAFKFTTGKVHRLRLINGGTEGFQKFSIDGHSFEVISQDYVSVTPFTTDVISLGIGQRTDILVTANMPSDTAVWMRSTISSGGGCTGSEHPAVMAAIFYDGADTRVAPTSEPNESYSEEVIQQCYNDDIATNFVPSAPMPVVAPSTVQDVYVNLVENATGHFAWELNNQTFHSNYNLPIANQVSKGNLSFPDDWQVYNFGLNATIRINLFNNINATHPWHVHGRDMLILSEGEGQWDGTTIINPANPVRRDVHTIRAFGHLVMQFDGDNAGVWPVSPPSHLTHGERQC